MPGADRYRRLADKGGRDDLGREGKDDLFGDECRPRTMQNGLTDRTVTLMTVGQRGAVVLGIAGASSLMPGGQLVLPIGMMESLIGDGQRNLNKCREREQEDGDLSLENR